MLHSPLVREAVATHGHTGALRLGVAGTSSAEGTAHAITAERRHTILQRAVPIACIIVQLRCAGGDRFVAERGVPYVAHGPHVSVLWYRAHADETVREIAHPRANLLPRAASESPKRHKAGAPCDLGDVDDRAECRSGGLADGGTAEAAVFMRRLGESEAAPNGHKDAAATLALVRYA